MGLLQYSPPTSAPTTMPSNPSIAPTVLPSAPSLPPTYQPSTFSSITPTLMQCPSVSPSTLVLSITPTLMPCQNVFFTNFVIQSRLETACLDTCGGNNGAQMRSWSFCYVGSANQLATSNGQSISFSGQCLDAAKDVVKNGRGVFSYHSYTRFNVNVFVCPSGDPVVLNPCVADNPRQYFQFQGYNKI